MKKLALFDYQSELSDKIRRHLPAPVLGVLPTGGGKTVIFCDFVRRMAEKNPKSFALILVHREELAVQTADTLERMGLQAGAITAKGCFVGGQKVHSKVKTGLPCYVAMVETLHSRRAGILYDWLLRKSAFWIIDEAHNTSFCKIIDLHPEKLRIGFTATPLFATKAKKISHYWPRLAVGPPPAELILRGRLEKPAYYEHQIDEAQIAK
jgi:superfamily II DNA or RNA helicase